MNFLKIFIPFQVATVSPRTTRIGITSISSSHRSRGVFSNSREGGILEHQTPLKSPSHSPSPRWPWVATRQASGPAVPALGTVEAHTSNNSRGMASMLMQEEDTKPLGVHRLVVVEEVAGIRLLGERAVTSRGEGTDLQVAISTATKAGGETIDGDTRKTAMIHERVLAGDLQPTTAF